MNYALSVSGELISRCSCPCLTCSVKITQVGISEVVYSQSYGIDKEVSIDMVPL